MSTNIPCVLMRGGTSRGPFFLADWLPQDPEARDRTLIAALGSPHDLQIDKPHANAKKEEKESAHQQNQPLSYGGSR